MELTQELVKELFDYKDGCLYWKKLPIKNQVKIGDKAGYLKDFGYYRIFISNKEYVLSRIIFLWHHGYIPTHVDHIDRNRSNNRIENLREATPSQNSCNRTSAKNSTSKYLGVGLYNKNTKSRPPLWLACIKNNKQPQIKIGVFESEEQAALEYNRYAVFYHGEFASLNIIDKPFKFAPKRVYDVPLAKQSECLI